MFKVRLDLAAITALSAMVRGAEPAFPSNRPFLPNPPHERDITRRQQRARNNQSNQADNRRKRAGLRDPDEAALQHQINGMTNWQRSQWGRAGYKPGQVEKYLCMRKPAA